MADQTSASIDIAATPEQVMAVIADFEHYPEWVDSMKSAEVLTSVRARPRRSGWCSTTRWSRTTTSWRTTGSRRRQLETGRGEAAQGDGRLVRAEAQWGQDNSDLHLTVDVNMPMIGMFKRKAEKTIIDGALKGLKKRVEG